MFKYKIEGLHLLHAWQQALITPALQPVKSEVLNSAFIPKHLTALLVQQTGVHSF